MRKLARWMRGHFTYTIDNADGSKSKATEIWMNAAAHLSGDHTKCSELCDDADCSDSTVRLRTPKMIEVMTKFLNEKGLIDDFESYRTDRSTSWIESFSNTLAAFADKRLFFNIKALRLRHILAILSWNELCKGGNWWDEEKEMSDLGTRDIRTTPVRRPCACLEAKPNGTVSHSKTNKKMKNKENTSGRVQKRDVAKSA